MKPLSEISRTDLEEYIFPGTDAAVLTVEQKMPQTELEAIFGGISQAHRLYPTDKGWAIKFPYWYVSEVLKREGAGFTV